MFLPDKVICLLRNDLASGLLLGVAVQSFGFGGGGEKGSFASIWDEDDGLVMEYFRENFL